MTDASFASDHPSTGELRERIGETLHTHDEDFIHHARLVATELASNACDHADDPRHLMLRREVHPVRTPTELLRRTATRIPHDVSWTGEGVWPTH